MLSICKNIVFLSHFLEVQTYNLFYFILIFCIQITSSFQLFSLIFFFVQYFFRYVFCLMVSSFSRSFGIFFFFKCGFSALFLLIFVVKFSFLKSIESISVLKKCPASAGILFFCLLFRRYRHIIYFFYLDLLYLDNQQFLAILFDLFLCPIFF